MTEQTPKAWADALSQLRSDFDALQRRAHALATVPPDAAPEELARAWSALSGSSSANGTAAGSFALAHLKLLWGRGGESLAYSFTDTLRHLSGLLQAAPGAFATATIPPKAIMFFNGSDGCTPNGIITAQDGLFCAAYRDLLPADHPLRQALTDDDSFYWLESAGYEPRRFVFLLGGVVLGQNGSSQPPDYLDTARVCLMTKLAAESKHQRRRKELHERQIKEAEDAKKEARLLRQLRWNSMGADAQVELIEKLEREVAEIKAKVTAK